jgi:hypothetical protein
MDEATWLSSTHFQKLYGSLKSGQGTALTKGGRRKLRLLACACCRVLLWHMPVRDCDRKAVEAAEAFADGLIDGEALAVACQACYPPWPEKGPGARACAAMVRTTDKTAASAAYVVPLYALTALGPEDDLANRKRLCDLVRCAFGNPFRPLRPRAFPAHVVALARECYDAFPIVSDRFLILADALTDLGEEQAAEHCRQQEHAKGCHVLDWILGRG